MEQYEPDSHDATALGSGFEECPVIRLRVPIIMLALLAVPRIARSQPADAGVPQELQTFGSVQLDQGEIRVLRCQLRHKAPCALFLGFDQGPTAFSECQSRLPDNSRNVSKGRAFGHLSRPDRATMLEWWT